MTACPKPQPRPPNGRQPIARRTRPARTTSYDRPEYQALFRVVRKRSGGICEVCRSAPAVGWGNHLWYSDHRGWKRLIVPADWIVDSCHDCHVAFHLQYGHRKDLPVYRPGIAAPSFALDFLAVP